MNETWERRYIPDLIQMRGKPGEGAVIEGHAAVFNSATDIGGWWKFREQIAPGAFAKTIKEADVRALFNHDPNYVLGRNRSGSLKLREDDRGLWYEVDLPDTQQARDVYALIERGDVNQSSFAFSVVKEEWSDVDSDNPLRTLKELKLYDVSPVTYPAYEETDVDVARALRSFSAFLNQPLNDLIRSHGERSDTKPQSEPQGEPPLALDRTRLALDELDLLVVELGLI